MTLSLQGQTLEKFVHSVGARGFEPHGYTISLQGQTLELFFHRVWRAA